MTNKQEQTGPAKSGSILYIDDDSMSREIIGVFLRESGYRVSLAENGENGLSLFVGDNPDLVLLDLRMPEMDGFEVLKDIRSRDKEVPVLVISGVGEMDDVIQAIWLGATNYVIKSLDNLSLLKEAVDKALYQLELVREKQRYQDMLVEALDENKRLSTQLESIFDSIPDGIITVDAEGRVLKFNEAVRSMCPIGSEISVGKSIYDLGARNGEFCLRLLEQSVREHRPFLNRRVECPYAEWTQKVNLVTTAPLYKDQGQLSGATLILKDISRQEELEDQIQERRSFKNIIGKSQAMQRVYNMIRQLANVDSTVLITGESGTGKECVMDALHFTGHRSGGPLCKVNCSALSEELLDSELFGHVKGAFTGAHKDKIGRFEFAHGGTIFLDEIGEISHRIQLKLLRVLETKAFERVGSSKTITADVRIVSATNVDLAQKVQEGEFREDLYYRLRVLGIYVPSLRKRKDDIPLLVDYFCRHFSRQFEKEILGVSNEVMEIFLNYEWPGNVRELKHALEHGCLLSPGGEVKVENLPLELIEYIDPDKLNMKTDKPMKLTRGKIEEALSQAQGNKIKASELLGIHRKTLYRKMHKFGIPLKLK